MKLPQSNEVRKPSKTLAGVTPVAVVCKPQKCKHGACVYCPNLDVPQSYTPLSPAVIRARMLDYDAEKQVVARLKAFKVMNHPTDKIEIIVMGGTFLQYDEKYQHSFIKGIYEGLNGKKSRTLEEAKRLNEKTEHRCVALCVETRPDTCSEKEIKKLLNFGCTRVELGVQAIDDRIYKLVNRGHSLKDVVEATKRLKNSGFKVGYHIMPGLPGSNVKKDLQMFRKMFSSQDFKPDQLKIYPCQVMKGSKLVEWYEKGKYMPYTKEEIQEVLIKMLKIVPEYCRVMRIMREIPPVYLVEGTTRIDLRKDIDEELKKKKVKLNEIRYREIGFALRDLNKKGKNSNCLFSSSLSKSVQNINFDNKKKWEEINQDINIKKIEYKSSGGKEIFLQAVNKDNILFGLLRLRFLSKIFIPELKNSAIIREIHVYGQAEAIGKEKRGNIQHKGLGKKLMAEAEELARRNAKKFGIKKIAVISGVGVREYYRKLGYKLEGNYMCKNL